MRRPKRFFLLLSLSVMSSLFMPLTPAQNEQISVALFIDEGTEASEFSKEFRRNTDATITYKKINGADIRNGALKNFDVLVIPGGSASTESYSMGPEARAEVKRFVNDGGIYLGVCAGAYLVSRLKDTYLGMLPLKTVDETHWYRTDGAPMLDVELTKAGMEIFGINRPNVKIAYENGPVFGPPFEGPDPSFRVLGTFRSEVVADGGKPGVMIGAPAIILSRYGRGVILIISPHPEETPGMKQVELHAIRWLYEHRNLPVATQMSKSIQAPSSIVRSPEPVGQTNKWEALAASSSFNAENRTAIVPVGEPCSVSGTAPHPVSNETKLGGESRTLNQRALNLAESIFDNATVVSYEHREVPASRQVITESDGSVEARTDCSGFISYIVHSIAPRHYVAVRSQEPNASYPQAKIWARFFDTLDPDQPHDGWLGIRSWKNLEPGDIIAWKAGSAAARNTGHVMMVASNIGRVQQEGGYRYVEIPVIDCSSVYHFGPEHLPPKAYQKHRDGLGIGCIRLVLSPEDEPIGYWEGTYWGEGDKHINGPSMSELIRFGRLVSLVDYSR